MVWCSFDASFYPLSAVVGSHRQSQRRPESTLEAVREQVLSDVVPDVDRQRARARQAGFSRFDGQLQREGLRIGFLDTVVGNCDRDGARRGAAVVSPRYLIDRGEVAAGRGAAVHLGHARRDGCFAAVDSLHPDVEGADGFQYLAKRCRESERTGIGDQASPLRIQIRRAGLIGQ